MAKEMETPKDEGLQGNETIEEAILGLQKEPTPELLAHVLTVILRRMREGGQGILSVEPPGGDSQIRIGTVKSADRFVRASFFIKHVPTNFARPQAFAAINSIMGTVSVPYGYEIEGEPNVSSTQWTSFADLSAGRYYFRFADNLGTFYIDMRSLILRPGAPVLKLDTSEPDRYGYFDNVNEHLKKSEPFTPMW